MYEELIAKLQKNNRMSGWTHIDRLMDEAIEAIEALQQENEQLRKTIVAHELTLQEYCKTFVQQVAVLQKAREAILLEKGLINHLRRSTHLKSKKWEKIVENTIAEIDKAIGGQKAKCSTCDCGDIENYPCQFGGNPEKCGKEGD